MNDQIELGPHISKEDLEKLPKEMREKYHKERLEAKIANAQAVILQHISRENENYSYILQKFNKVASESDELKALLLENKKIVEIIEAVLCIVVPGRHTFVSEMEEINRSIKIVFKSDLGQDPWKSKLLGSIGDNSIYIDQVDPLVIFFKELDIPEEEYKATLAKTLKKTEDENGVSLVEILLIEKKYGLEIDSEMTTKILARADQSLKHLDFVRAVEMYEALVETGAEIGEQRAGIIIIYRSYHEGPAKNEFIKKIGIEMNIIPKPREPEKRDEKEIKDENNAKKPWWKFWR